MPGAADQGRRVVAGIQLKLPTGKDDVNHIVVCARCLICKIAHRHCICLKLPRKNLNPWGGLSVWRGMRLRMSEQLVLRGG